MLFQKQFQLFFQDLQICLFTGKITGHFFGCINNNYFHNATKLILTLVEQFSGQSSSAISGNKIQKVIGTLYVAIESVRLNFENGICQ